MFAQVITVLIRYSIGFLARGRPTICCNWAAGSIRQSAFSGPASNAALLRAHAINPALQPTLGCIPAITLAERYRIGDQAYAYGLALTNACRLVLGDGLDRLVQADLILLQDTGLDRLAALHQTLRDRYTSFDHAAAREIVQWLDGAYEITDEIVLTQ